MPGPGSLHQVNKLEIQKIETVSLASHDFFESHFGFVDSGGLREGVIKKVIKLGSLDCLTEGGYKCLGSRSS